MQCMAPGMCFPNMMHQPSMFTQNRCMNGGYGSSMIGVHPGMMSGPMGCGSPLSMMGMMPRPLPMQFGSPLMGGRYGHLPYGSPLLSQSSSFGLNAGLGLNLGIGGLNFGIGANFGLQRSRYSHLTRPNVGLGIPGGYPIAPRFPRQRTPIALPFRGTSARR